jgi:AcrR family transcriptional regulator
MKSAKTAGRPREFDSEKALNAAMKVFWRKGYEGASLTDLTKAMGINRPSLYAAFGDKEELFRKVLAQYAEGPTAYIGEALQAPTARVVAERLLSGTAEVLGDPKNPRGCLGVQSALACGAESDSIRRELISFRQAGEKLILERFKSAKTEGDLPADADPADLASYVITVIRGMAVDAASGASREELQRVARTAMQAWPK